MTVLVIDKNNIVRERIAGLVSRLDDVTHVTQSRTYDCLTDFLSLLKPDIVLFDYFQFREFERDALKKYFSQNKVTQPVVYLDDSLWEESLNDNVDNQVRLLKFSEIIDFIKEYSVSRDKDANWKVTDSLPHG